VCFLYLVLFLGIVAGIRSVANVIVLKLWADHSGSKSANTSTEKVLLPAIMGTSKSKSTSMTNTRAPTALKYQLVEEVQGKRKRFAAFSNFGDPISIDEWIHMLNGNDESADNHITSFVNFMKEASSPYKAIFFETKGTSASNNKTKQFEFVLVNSRRLYGFVRDKPPGIDAFEEYFGNDDRTSVAFTNLGGTSVLISPKPQPSNSNNIYTDIASFIRNAPEKEIVSLWKLVVQEYHKRLEEKGESVWLSTSGLGVPWLHAR
jgi:hypothetical protein